MGLPARVFNPVQDFVCLNFAEAAVGSMHIAEERRVAAQDAESITATIVNKAGEQAFRLGKSMLARCFEVTTPKVEYARQLVDTSTPDLGALALCELMLDRGPDYFRALEPEDVDLTPYV